MSVLVWVMSDGEHQDAVATCRTGDGKWLALRWDWRDVGGMLGFAHDEAWQADENLADWVAELEADGCVLKVDPILVSVPIPRFSDDGSLLGWWDWSLKPAVEKLCDGPFVDDGWECTLSLPPSTGIHAAWEALTTKDLYSAKLAWGP